MKAYETTLRVSGIGRRHVMRKWIESVMSEALNASGREMTGRSRVSRASDRQENEDRGIRRRDGRTTGGALPSLPSLDDGLSTLS